MVFKFGLMCCDAPAYLWMANECAVSGKCWDSLRPVGMQLYSAIPILLWKNVEYLVLLNMLMVGVSALLGAFALGDLFPRLKKGFPSFLVRLAISAAAYGVFVWGDAHVPLSDLPSACFALNGAWLFAMAASRKKTHLFALAGLCLGASAFVRIFYLYPALLTLAALWIFGRAKLPKNGLLFLTYMALLPILSQYAITHNNTGSWTYIDKIASKDREGDHMRSPLWGWDTTVAGGQGVGAPYEGGCLKGPEGITGAWQRGEWAAIACFITQRQNFYFGSHCGHTYLAEKGERTFSGWILLANLLAIALALLAVLSGPEPGRLAPFFFMAANWGLASVIVPEGRFMMATLVFVWLYAAGQAISMLGGSDARA